MACATCGCHGGRGKIGTVINTSILLIVWSLLLICLFENRLKGEVAALQEAHQKKEIELRESHERFVASHVEQQLQRIGALPTAPRDPAAEEAAAAAAVAGSAVARVGAAGAEVLPGPHPADASSPAFQDAGLVAAASLRGRPEEAPVQQPVDVPRAAAQVAMESAPATDAATVSGASKTGGAKPRRLPGFYSVGTTAAGVGCLTVTGATTNKDMSSSSCRGASNRLCTGCFIATDDANNKVLNVVKCSTALYKVGGQLSSTSHVFMIEIINADPTNTLTVKGCDDTTCSPAASSYLLAADDSAVGYCYAGGSNKIYFATSGIQNANTFDFSGATITDLGTVTTADINGGTIDGATITGGTIDISGGTLTLAAGQIAATKVTGGIFVSGQSYSFAGSTIASTGTVQTADIDGGTIDGATVATTDITMSGQTLDMSSGTLTLDAGSIAATKITGGTFKSGQTYSFASSTITNSGTIQTVDINGGAIDGATVATSDITVGSGKTLDVSSGTLTLGGGQISAAALKGGTFKASETYSFASSTMTSLGTVQAGTIQGTTTIDSVVIGGSTPDAGTFTTLTTGSSTGNVLTLGLTGSQSGDTVTSNTQTGVITATSGLGSNAVRSISLTNSVVSGTGSIVLAIAGECSNGDVGVIGVVPASGSVTIKVKNHDDSNACSSTFKVYFAVFP